MFKRKVFCDRVFVLSRHKKQSNIVPIRKEVKGYCTRCKSRLCSSLTRDGKNKDGYKRSTNKSIRDSSISVRDVGRKKERLKSCLDTNFKQILLDPKRIVRGGLRRSKMGNGLRF